jgi:2-isopropylmalate synthase
MNLKTRKNFFNVETNVNSKELFKTSCMVAQLTGISVQRNKAIVGANAFAHEAGIHQHGVLKNPLTYEIMRPEDIGWEGTCIVIGKHSGKHAVETLLKKKGINASEEDINQITEKVKQLADEKKNVSEEDVFEIVNEVIKL